MWVMPSRMANQHISRVISQDFEPSSRRGRIWEWMSITASGRRHRSWVLRTRNDIRLGGFTLGFPRSNAKGRNTHQLTKTSATAATAGAAGTREQLQAISGRSASDSRENGERQRVLLYEIQNRHPTRPGPFDHPMMSVSASRKFDSDSKHDTAVLCGSFPA